LENLLYLSLIWKILSSEFIFFLAQNTLLLPFSAPFAFPAQSMLYSLLHFYSILSVIWSCLFTRTFWPFLTPHTIYLFCSGCWCKEGLQNGVEVLHACLTVGSCACLLQSCPDACHWDRNHAQLSHSHWSQFFMAFLVFIFWFTAFPDFKLQLLCNNI